MIVPMKKVFLVLLEAEKRQALKSLRKLGLVHLEELEGHSDELSMLKGEQSNLETALRLLQDLKLEKSVKPSNPIDESDSVIFADKVISLFDEKSKAQSEIIKYQLELDRLSRWGGVNLEDFSYLSEKGVHLHLYEIPANKYATLPEDIETVFVNQDKNTARFLLFTQDDIIPNLPAEAFKVDMPEKSTSVMEQNIKELFMVMEQAVEEEIHQLLQMLVNVQLLLMN
jgi:V/A-type H+-transporting ATPase subunit I